MDIDRGHRLVARLLNVAIALSIAALVGAVVSFVLILID